MRDIEFQGAHSGVQHTVGRHDRGALAAARRARGSLGKKTLVNRCLWLRPESEDLLGLTTDPDRTLMAGVKTALLRDLARRSKQLDDQIATLNKHIDALVRADAPKLVQMHASESRSPANFPSPPPTTLNASATRPRSPSSAESRPSPPPPPTRNYVERRTADGLSKREIIRCLKRCIAREVFTNLPQPTANNPATKPVLSAA